MVSSVAVPQKLQRNVATLLQRSQLHQAQRRTYQPHRRPFPGRASRQPLLPESGPDTVHDATITADLFGGHPPARICKIPPSARRGHPQGLIHSLVLFRARGRDFSPIESKSDITSTNFTHPMLTYVQITSAPTADTPGASVLLHFDDRRYAFGRIAEGTQRVFTQRKIGMSKLDELFISGPVRWSSTGGLLGMILTIADVLACQKVDTVQIDAKKKKKSVQRQPLTPSLKIYGAENITHMIATARKFIFRKGLPLRLHEITHDPGNADNPLRKPDFEDANVKVWYVSLLPEETKPHGRKRSHDDMEAGDDAEVERREGKKLVKSVVDNMFDSDWDLDAMVETTLYKVKLPATIFVREDGKLKKYDGPMPSDKAADCPDIPVLIRTPWPATGINELPRTTPSRQSMSYIVKGQQRRGKFNVEAANSFGVKKQEFKLLTAGQTVKGKDGIDVTPEMCVDPPIEGHGFAFIDLPDLTYVDAFLARPEWEDITMMSTVDAMYWNLGRVVLHDERIQKFMKDHQTKHHRIFSPDMSPNTISMESSASQMLKMHQIDPDRFPQPVCDNEFQASSPDNLFEVARVGAKLQLAPRVELKNDEIVPLMDSKDQCHRLPNAVAKLAKQARARLADQSFIDSIEQAEVDIPNRDTEVIALGTGSSLPSKYRNVSATLVRVPGVGSYLFDAGESTLGQLRRMYGFAKTDEILADLKGIWISHLHADHHLGTVSIIKAWRDVTASLSPPPRLLVASHINMLDWLREYADVEDYGYSRLVLTAIRGPGRPESIQEPFILDPTLAAATGLVRIDAARVDHCHGALACVFTFSSGLRVAYSGDCRPSRAFAEIGRDATLLIHESTLDDELQGDALAKKHCTMSEALRVARNMRARRVLLTHFSQRYPWIPKKLSAGASEDAVKDQVVLLAFDQMCVKLGDFQRAELFLPALRELLALGDDQDD